MRLGCRTGGPPRTAPRVERPRRPGAGLAAGRAARPCTSSRAWGGPGPGGRRRPRSSTGASRRCCPSGSSWRCSSAGPPEVRPGRPDSRAARPRERDVADRDSGGGTRRRGGGLAGRLELARAGRASARDRGRTPARSMPARRRRRARHSNAGSGGPPSRMRRRSLTIRSPRSARTSAP